MPKLEPNLKAFFAVAIALAVVRVVLAYLSAPPLVALILSLILAVLFLAAPLYGLYRGSQAGWTRPLALKMLLGGVAIHVAGGLLLARVLPEAGLPTVLVGSLVQIGLLTWCLGLGALLALSIKDKNLIVPIALFLIGFDMFLVFAPVAPTHRMIQDQAEFAQQALMGVPRVATPEERQEHQGAKVVEIARVGPADFFFVAAFFAILSRFKMRAKQTLMWLAPVLGLYLLVVIVFGHLYIGPISLGMLPAMVPIGLTFLAVNRREFSLNKEEKASTALVAAIAFGLAVAGIWMAMREPAQGEGPEALPAPAASVSE